MAEVEVLKHGSCYGKDLIFHCDNCGCEFKAYGPKNRYVVEGYEHDDMFGDTPCLYYACDCPECGMNVSIKAKDW